VPSLLSRVRIRGAARGLPASLVRRVRSQGPFAGFVRIVRRVHPVGARVSAVVPEVSPHDARVPLVSP
jgi:hypothetical protein